LIYQGDFAEVEQQFQKVPKPDARMIGALAFSQLGQGRVGDAAETYKKLAATGAFGASFAAAGIADLAFYEGRFTESVRLFEEGVAADLAAKAPDRAALKLSSLAYVHLARGDRTAAAATARRALQRSTVAPIRFLSGRVFVEAGDLARAREIAKEFATSLGVENQAYGKIIEGNVALKSGDARRAIDLLTEANGVLDTWLGRFDLGRAYMQAKGFFQAEAEFDRCIQRRGEALALVQEDPTYGQLPMAYYYLGRVREELGTVSVADSYRKYLEIRGQSSQDPLLSEVRKRITK
jgi:tetratricopeptide (TPR) repeat protein